MPLTLTKIVYSVNSSERAFGSIGLRFGDQGFQGEDLVALEEGTQVECPVVGKLKTQTVKIKQRNTPEGVSMICGLWLLDTEGNDKLKIDLSPGLGSWRVQMLGHDEYIVGYHYYVMGDDEESIGGKAGSDEVAHDDEKCQPLKSNSADRVDSAWLDSFGFIAYKFELY